MPSLGICLRARIAARTPHRGRWAASARRARRGPDSSAGGRERRFRIRIRSGHRESRLDENAHQALAQQHRVIADKHTKGLGGGTEGRFGDAITLEGRAIASQEVGSSTLTAEGPPTAPCANPDCNPGQIAICNSLICREGLGRSERRPQFFRSAYPPARPDSTMAIGVQYSCWHSDILRQQPRPCGRALGPDDGGQGTRSHFAKLDVRVGRAEHRCPLHDERSGRGQAHRQRYPRYHR